MSKLTHDQVEEIFCAALEREPQERAAYVREAAGGDVALEERVRALLESHTEAGGFLPPPAEASGKWPEGELDAAGRKLGGYTIRRTIASGGMGVVYEAEQDHPHRVVALKVLRRAAASRQAMRRFEHEVEILGHLQHPNIAQVHDAGTFDEGEGAQPYFAMEYIHGRPLIEYVDTNDLSTRDRLALFAKVGDGVQYAHQRGVVHRDLKPDNILVDDQGEPKILDFGIARATDSDIQTTTLRTDIGQLIGTVPYMSPEQVAGDPHQLDTRSDVYSLGVLLYELLADRLPHDLKDRTIPEAVRIIGENDPTPLSSINRTFRGDLDTIVAKALEKEKDRRYQSAAELAADVRHYLSDEPIVARPASTFYQLSRFARRNKALVGGIIGMFALLVAGTTVSSIGFLRASDQAEKAELIGTFLEEVIASPGPYRGKADVSVLELLEGAAPQIEDRFAAHPELAVRVRMTFGSTYAALARDEEAVSLLRAAYEQGNRNLGKDHPLTLEAGGLLAISLMRLGQPETVPLLKNLHERHVRVYGEAHEETLGRIVTLGWAVGLHRDHYPDEAAEAEAAVREARELAMRVHGDDAYVTFQLTFSLATVTESRIEQLQCYQWALEYCRRRIAQADDPTELAEWELTATSVTCEYASRLGWTGRPEEAAELAMEAAAIQEERFGLANYWTRTGLQIAGKSLQWSGRLEEAEEYYEKSRRAWIESAGSDYSTLAHVDFLLARVRLLQGTLSPAEALPTIRKAAEELAQRKKRIWQDPALVAWAYCLNQLGEYEEAQRVLARVQETWFEELAIPEDHYERRLYHETLADTYEGLGQPEKAAEYRRMLDGD